MNIKVKLTRPNGKAGFVYRQEKTLGSGAWSRAYLTKSPRWVLLETNCDAQYGNDRSKHLMAALSGKSIHFPLIRFAGSAGDNAELEYWHMPFYADVSNRTKDVFDEFTHTIDRWNRDGAQHRSMRSVDAVMASRHLPDSLKIAYYMLISEALKQHGSFRLDVAIGNCSEGKRGQLILRDPIVLDVPARTKTSV